MKKNVSKCHKLIMRISSFYIIIVLGLHSLFATEINGQALKRSNVMLNNKAYNLEELFGIIESKTNYNFIISEDQINLNTSVGTFWGEVNLLELLEKVSKENQLRFYRINELISVSKIKSFPIRKKVQVVEQMTIHGKVVDQDGVPLPGASVQVNGKTLGVVTDFNGDFTITAQKGDEVTITYIGFISQTITIGDEEEYQIQLLQDVSELDEVVVTALGIKREEKKLGYAQQTVKSEQLTDARTNNWSEALRGKVPGLSIQSLGGPLNSQQIKLRGDNSLDPGANAALIVVDGVPVTSELSTSGASNSYMGGDASNDTPVDFGNGIADINPDDIDNVSVLKGAGAAALYGSRAANGVVIITTKSGKKQKGLGVSVSSNTRFDVITRWPDWQYEYGQGSGKGSYVKPDGTLYYSYGASEDGKSTGGSSSAFGPKFDGQYYYQYDPTLEGQSAERQLWQPYKDNRKDFWRVGTTYTQNVSIQGGGEKGSMRTSITHLKNDWIMPNTGYEQMSVSLNGNYQVSNAIKLSSVINYRNRQSDNLPGHGYNNHSIAYFMIFQNPNVDLSWYEPIWKEGKEQVDMIRPFSGYIDNPYAMAYEMTNSLDQNSVTGNVKADVAISPKLNLMLRGALNSYSKGTEQQRPYDINRYSTGFFKKTNIYSEEVNTDFLLTYTNKFSNFDVSGSLGGNVMKYKYRRLDSWTEGLETPGIYNLANGTNLFTSAYDGNEQVNSLYGMASFGYKNRIFLDITGRNDWSSTLPKNNWSFFYPSVNTSVILSELLNFPEVINFTKLRFSYAEVGNDAPRYSTSKYYGKGPYPFPSSAVAPTTLYNADLKPELTKSIEAGFNMRMFNSRINLDFAVYRTLTVNQILRVPLTRSTGYSTAWINSGEVRNIGAETMLSFKPVKNNSFEWESIVNWSLNRSKVLSLDPRLEGKLQMLSSSSARLVGVEGGSATALYGRGFERSPDGEVLYDENGHPQMTDSDIYIGETTPKWQAGFINNFKFNNFRISMTIDGRYGGVIYSHTHHKLTQQGKLKHTLRGREEGELVGDGVVDNGDGTYSPNTTPLPIAVYYDEHYKLANTEANSFDASFVKLREISFEYSLPKKFLAPTFLQAAKFSIYGRNLAVISDFPIYDPEVAGQAGGTKLYQGVEVGQMPVPTEFGMNVKIDF
ncbi:SusC/RagA family TonB-linked outer membrane protein [Galbibacter pacificus]|uniref:SusC/RagA family TonB-linked outer membrane protein n=1 Tax=Galbibacter pacificus TaxID=2996052 RepID=A0ABT6FR46_9FLAO|nr:SusC/RagA family TonB-linked outer membrane protein [Galbibacter pacificus]MDG3581786.1 SusC/RagA family TonB-linked outer membrane protein [Galbibacter pacificus]MDG3585740.1 SusC/RagA family TonB-linked outer membrane protein [Galbibacter pacificus]